MSEMTIIQFLIALIAPFMIAYGIGYFIRKSIRLIAFMFGMFFFIVGILWYAEVIGSFRGSPLGFFVIVRINFLL